MNLILWWLLVLGSLAILGVVVALAAYLRGHSDGFADCQRTRCKEIHERGNDMIQVAQADGYRSGFAEGVKEGRRQVEQVYPLTPFMQHIGPMEMAEYIDAWRN